MNVWFEWFSIETESQSRSEEKVGPIEKPRKTKTRKIISDNHNPHRKQHEKKEKLLSWKSKKALFLVLFSVRRWWFEMTIFLSVQRSDESTSTAYFFFFLFSPVNREVKIELLFHSHSIFLFLDFYSDTNRDKFQRKVDLIRSVSVKFPFYSIDRILCRTTVSNLSSFMIMKDLWRKLVSTTKTLEIIRRATNSL